MTEQEFTIHLEINLKKTRTNIESLKTLIQDSAINLNTTYEYFTHETDGVNNTIKKNTLLYVVEFDNFLNLEHYIEFINTIKQVNIELVCEEDKIIYMSNSYKKTLDPRTQQFILERIENLKNITKQTTNKYIHLYNLLPI